MSREELVRKTEEELNKLTLPRLKAYYAAEKAHYHKGENGWVWEIELSKEEVKDWFKYLMFVKALLKKRTDIKDN